MPREVHDVSQCLLTLPLEIFDNHFLTMIMYFPIGLSKSDFSSLLSFHQKRNATVPATMACDKTVTPLSHTPTSYYFSVASSEQTAQSIINATFYDNGVFFFTGNPTLHEQIPFLSRCLSTGNIISPLKL